MLKKISLGLLPKVLIAIVLGIVLGNWMPHWGIRVFVTFNDIFSQLLSFLVPLIILGLVAPAIAEIGAKAGKMLVVTALMIALRVALKPLAIPLGPQLSIQTAMLATALGAMIFGPVMAIPAAIISDTVGFILWPTGEYFLPFVLTEIASTMIYDLCLYRAKPSSLRVVLSRFFICFFVNVILQQLIFAWQYAYMGNPEESSKQILGMFTVARIFKNLCFFPIESVVLTLFLKVLLPITSRARLTHGGKTGLDFSKKQIVVLAILLVKIMVEM